MSKRIVLAGAVFVCSLAGTLHAQTVPTAAPPSAPARPTDVPALSSAAGTPVPMPFAEAIRRALASNPSVAVAAANILQAQGRERRPLVAQQLGRREDGRPPDRRGSDRCDLLDRQEAIGQGEHPLCRGALSVRLRPCHHRIRAAERRALPGQAIRPNESRRDLGRASSSRTSARSSTRLSSLRPRPCSAARASHSRRRRGGRTAPCDRGSGARRPWRRRSPSCRAARGSRAPAPAAARTPQRLSGTPAISAIPFSGSRHSTPSERVSSNRSWAW